MQILFTMLNILFYTKIMERIIKFWFFKVSRGYSLPMCITNWLVIFCLGIQHNGNILFGIIALIGLLFAQMGTNVFDDAIDHWLKVPKQQYKSTYLDNGETNLKTILILAIVYFSIAASIGLFFTIKCGIFVLVLAIIGGLIALIYPKLNNFALGELAVSLTFGPLMFMGVYYVMCNSINPQAILLSIPATIFTVAVLMIHALMDYDFDKKSGKKTLVLLTGSKQNGLNLIYSLLVFAYIFTGYLIFYKHLAIYALASLITIPSLIVLYKKLSQYNNADLHTENDFINNFSYARNIGTIYCLIITATIILKIFKVPFS